MTRNCTIMCTYRAENGEIEAIYLEANFDSVMSARYRRGGMDFKLDQNGVSIFGVATAYGQFENVSVLRLMLKPKKFVSLTVHSIGFPKNT